MLSSIPHPPPPCARPSTITCQWPLPSHRSVPPPPPYCTRPSTCQWPPPRHHSSGTHWSSSGMTVNKLTKIINGNRRLGYNLSMWNCRRGLINRDKESSLKMVEVRNFIEQNKLHMFCLVESDLHGELSRYKRAQPLTTKDIKSNGHPWL